MNTVPAGVSCSYSVCGPPNRTAVTRPGMTRSQLEVDGARRAVVVGGLAIVIGLGLGIASSATSVHALGRHQARPPSSC
jgi:hypothetical protein